MDSEKDGHFKIIHRGGMDFARFLLVMGPYAAHDSDILRKESRTTDRVFEDDPQTGGQVSETLLLRSGDILTVLSKDGAPFAFVLDLLLCRDDGEKPAVEKGTTFHTIWSPREFFEIVRGIMAEYGSLVSSEDVDPRRSGEPYHFEDRFRMPYSLDEVEIFYLNKDRKRIGDVRFHIRMN